MSFTNYKIDEELDIVAFKCSQKDQNKFTNQK